MSTELATTSSAETAVGFTSNAGFELLQRASKMMASSTIVPDSFRGNMSNCAIALAAAHRMGVDPLALMQNMSIIHGKPSLSSAWLIATFNSCGRFTALQYEFIGTKGQKDYGCRAWATERATGEKVVGPDVTIEMAAAEGWSTKAGSKWKTMPDLMLRYRSAAFLIRTVAPELALGFRTAEEERDMIDVNAAPKAKRGKSLADIKSEAGIVVENDLEVIDSETGEIVTEPEVAE